MVTEPSATLGDLLHVAGEGVDLHAVDFITRKGPAKGVDAYVLRRLNGGPWQLVGEFVEIESGRRAPQLEGALAACKKQKAKLVVAKLDRLARNTRFLLTLNESGVEVLSRRNIMQRRRLAPSSTRRSSVSYSAMATRCAALPASWRSARCKRHAEAHGTRSSSSALWSGLLRRSEAS
jgi:hypothetical protein